MKALIGATTASCGFTAFGAEASELMAVAQTAILGSLPYTGLARHHLDRPDRGRGIDRLVRQSAQRTRRQVIHNPRMRYCPQEPRTWTENRLVSNKSGTARPLAAFTCEICGSPTGSDDSWRSRTAATRSCILRTLFNVGASARSPTASCSSGSPPAAVSRESWPLLHWSSATGRSSCACVVPSCATRTRPKTHFRQRSWPWLARPDRSGCKTHWPPGCTRRPIGLRFTTDRRQSAPLARTRGGRAPGRIGVAAAPWQR